MPAARIDSRGERRNQVLRENGAASAEFKEPSVFPQVRLKCLPRSDNCPETANILPVKSILPTGKGF
ncbi:hypothetical protein CKO51_22375 [Rhodopirellula sp. SM50]|nr:hypothetical protein CKO51_22375 [Rhodopirellula sp. SM50]